MAQVVARLRAVGRFDSRCAARLCAPRRRATQAARRPRRQARRRAAVETDEYAARRPWGESTGSTGTGQAARPLTPNAPAGRPGRGRRRKLKQSAGNPRYAGRPPRQPTSGSCRIRRACPWGHRPPRKAGRSSGPMSTRRRRGRTAGQVPWTMRSDPSSARAGHGARPPFLVRAAGDNRHARGPNRRSAGALDAVAAGRREGRTGVSEAPSVTSHVA